MPTNAGKCCNDLNEWRTFTGLGVDVARSRSDKTYQAHRYGPAIKELRQDGQRGHDADDRAGGGRTQGQGGMACVDVIGIGAGVVDRLREMKLRVLPFNASERTGHLGRERGTRFHQQARRGLVEFAGDPGSGQPGRRRPAAR